MIGIGASLTRKSLALPKSSLTCSANGQLALVLFRVSACKLIDRILIYILSMYHLLT
jgi:hypothetical protein